MKIGDCVKTPRFLTVRIADILTMDEAAEQGYKEPTYYDDPDFNVLGKHSGENKMKFAAVWKEK